MRWRFSVVLLFSVLSLGGVCTGPQQPRREFQLQANSDDFWTLVDRFEDKRFNSPNDVVMGPDGALYFTDPTLDLPNGQKQELPFQGVYRLDVSGKVTLLTKELSQPNGLAFSPDGKRFYVDDSEGRNIRVFDFTSEHTLANGRIFAQEPGGKGDGVPDGMKIDQAGNIYVTGPKGIWVWNPEIGRAHV